ncbi:MAG: hypothetical protein LBS72_10420 [Oscillospiraceae bacterium]|nr:hypothetical protein [Oscillospiraceae bacterium]
MPVYIKGAIDFIQQFQSAGDKDLILTRNIVLPNAWPSPAWSGKIILSGQDKIITTSKPLFASVGEGSLFEKVTLDIKYTGGEQNAGGFLKRQTKRVTFRSCTIIGEIRNIYDPLSLDQSTGAFCGTVNCPDPAAFALFEDCTNYCRIYANSNAGGIVGKAENCVFRRCKNDDEINDAALQNVNHKKNRVGGIVGYCIGGCAIKCENSGTITGRGAVGGIAGQTDKSFIYENINYGIVTSVKEDNSSHIGGIAGYAAASIIAQCRSEGKLVGNSEYTVRIVGGIVGQSDGSYVVANRNTAPISDGSNMAYQASSAEFGAGGIVGSIRDPLEGISSWVKHNVQDADVTGGVCVGGIVGNIHDTNNGSPTLIENNTVNANRYIAGKHAVGGVLGGIWYSKTEASASSGVPLDDGGVAVEIRGNRVAAAMLTADTDVFRITGGFYDRAPGHQLIAITPETKLTLDDNLAMRWTRMTGAENDTLAGNAYAFRGEGVTPFIAPFWYGANNKNGENAPDARPIGDNAAMRKESLSECANGITPTMLKLDIVKNDRIDPRYIHLGDAYPTEDGGIGTKFQISDFYWNPDAKYNVSVRLQSELTSVAIPNVKFELNGDGVSEEIASNYNGELILCGIKPGTYTLTLNPSFADAGWLISPEYKLNVLINGRPNIDGKYTALIDATVDPAYFPGSSALHTNVQSCAAL